MSSIALGECTEISAGKGAHLLVSSKGFESTFEVEITEEKNAAKMKKVS